MPVCSKCNNRFPNRVEIDGKVRVLGSRKFCLDCSPFGQHNTKDLTASEETKLCRRCGNVRPALEFYQRKNRSGITPYCKKCTCQQTIDRQRQLKQRAIDYKGGRCQSCGYDRCIAAFEFHHIEPDKKDFSITWARKKSFEKIIQELNKCLLVCSNCHREIHAGLITI